MKDATQKNLETCRPNDPPLQGVEYCLGKLFADKQHRCLDEICTDLTYEEVIGALLQARDILTTGKVARRRGQKYFNRHVITLLDGDGNAIGRWASPNGR